jgi:hypothetical protein
MLEPFCWIVMVPLPLAGSVLEPELSENVADPVLVKLHDPEISAMGGAGFVEGDPFPPPPPPPQEAKINPKTGTIAKTTKGIKRRFITVSLRSLSREIGGCTFRFFSMSSRLIVRQ